MPHSPPPAPYDLIVPLPADDDRPAVLAWQAHIAAGRIGTAPDPDPARAAVHAANAALLARRRRDAGA